MGVVERETSRLFVELEGAFEGAAEVEG